MRVASRFLAPRQGAPGPHPAGARQQLVPPCSATCTCLLRLSSSSAPREAAAVPGRGRARVEPTAPGWARCSGQGRLCALCFCAADKGSVTLSSSPGRKPEACFCTAAEERCWFICPLPHALAPSLPAKQPIPKTSSACLLAAADASLLAHERAGRRAGRASLPDPGKQRGLGCPQPAPVYTLHTNNLTPCPSCELLSALLHVAPVCLPWQPSEIPGWAPKSPPRSPSPGRDSSDALSEAPRERQRHGALNQAVWC